MTDLDRRKLAPEVATPDPDPLDSWSIGSLLVGAAFSLLGFAAMVVGAYGWLTR